MSDHVNLENTDAWVDEHLDYLYRYALARLHNPTLAEEAVQETFLAAWTNRDSYQGRSALRTWLTGILKHKILDYIRRRTRESQVIASSQTETLDDLFDGKGKALTPALPWAGDPRKNLERKEFWTCFHHCLSKMPRKSANAFALREIEGLEREEICKVLGVTPTHYWVLLHRARLKLRECLESNWFHSEMRKED
jgi:RNA polymerase sigma-70 factor (ECF subfamily)